MHELRELINKSVEHLSGKDVAVMYSGGHESFACTQSLIDVGARPHLYTFCVDGYDSYDLKKSRNDSYEFGLELTKVVIPNDVELLKKDVVEIVSKYGSRKTRVQCVHPLMYALKEVREHEVVMGIERGDLWGGSRLGSVIGRSRCVEEFNAYREEKAKKSSEGSFGAIKDYIRVNGFNLTAPFDTDDAYEWFMGKTFDYLMRPKEKQAMLDAYSDRLTSMTNKIINYQIGSGIRELHDKLLNTELNVGHHKSVVGVYNDIKRSIDRPRLF